MSEDKMLNDDPLDLLEDDGDGVIETILLFDESEKPNRGSTPQTKNSGCSVILIVTGGALITFWFGIIKMLA